MKITYKLLIDTARTNLTKIFNNSFLMNNLNNDVFFQLVLKQISILDFAEEKEKIKLKTSKDWLDKLNTINNTSEKKINVDNLNINEMYDELNYISIYIRNVFKYNFDNMESLGNDDKQSNSKSDLALNANNQVEKNYAKIDYNQSTPLPWTPDGIQEFMYLELVNKKMMEEIQSGKFYRYKTKPKSIIILKYMIAIITMIFGLLVVAKIIIGSLIGSINLPDNNSSAGYREFYLTQSWVIIGDVLTILCCIWMVYIIFNKHKNDNYKYYFQWYFVMIVLAIFGYNVIGDLITNLNTYWTKDQWTNPSFNNTEEKINLLFSYLYVMFINASVFFLIFIVSFIAIFFNPKLDVERVLLKQKELYNQIKETMSKKW